MAKYTNDELLEAFGEMTLVELSEFVKAFEEKFDVEAAAPVAAVAAVAGAAAPAEEEKDEFDVILSAVGDKKIQVIKLSGKRLAPAASSSDLCGISRNHSFSRNPAPVFQAAGFPHTE